MRPQKVNQRNSLGLNYKYISCFTDASHTHGLTLLIPADAESLNALTEGFIITSFLGPKERDSDWCHQENGGKYPSRSFFRTVPDLSHQKDDVLSFMR